MDLLLESAGATAVIVVAVFAGMMFARLGRPYWMVGYFVSVALVAALLAARCNTTLSFVPPFSWVVAGRARFIVSAWAIILGMVTPLPRLPHICEKYVVAGLAVLFVGVFSVTPYFAPVFFRSDLGSLQTTIDSHGICYQSRNYTCGPAAAVTALKKLGFDAEEGRIALLARSNPITGTLPKCLVSALLRLYGPAGLKCRYERFDSVGQLKGRGITLAVVKDAFMLDHCVAVLDVHDGAVVVADPAIGMQTLSFEQFEKTWRFTGITLYRDAFAAKGIVLRPTKG